MNNNKIRRYIVIGASSFLFLVFGIWELVDPNYWVGYVPPMLFKLMRPNILVIIHGIILAILGLWIITGKQLKIAAIVGTLVMLQIVLALLISSGFTDLFVRDFAIMLFVLSLVFEEK